MVMTLPKTAYINVYGEGAGLVPSMHNIGRNMVEFVERMSRNKIQAYYSVNLPPKATRYRLRFIPGASSRVPIIGNAISAKHELMHQFGLQHANIRNYDANGTIVFQRTSRDPFDVLTVSPGKPSLNAVHLHAAQWFSATEEAYLVPNCTYTLRVINDGSSNFRALKALYYKGPTRDFWFSYVDTVSALWAAQKGLPNTALAVHTSYGNGAGSFLEDLLGIGTTLHRPTGLVFELSHATRQYITVKTAMA